MLKISDTFHIFDEANKLWSLPEGTILTLKGENAKHKSS